MRRILLVVSLIFSTVTVDAQIFSASDSVDFLNFISYDRDGDGYGWHAIDLEGEGTNLDEQEGCVVSASWTSLSPLTPDNFLISPSIDLSNTNNVFISWGAGSVEATSTYFAEHYAVYVVDSIGLNLILTGTMPAPLWEGTLSEGGVMEYQSFDVSDYELGDHIHLVFRHYECTDMNYLLIDEIMVSDVVSVEDKEIASTVFPNPVNEQLHVSFSGSSGVLTINSMRGNRLLTKKLGSGDMTVDVSSLSPGMYFYTIEVGEGRTSRGTFIKK